MPHNDKDGEPGGFRGAGQVSGEDYESRRIRANARLTLQEADPGPVPEGWEPVPNTVALLALDPGDQDAVNCACYAWNQVRIDFEGRRCRYFILRYTPDGPVARAYWSPPGELKPWHPPADWLANLIEQWGVPHEPPELRRYVAGRFRPPDKPSRDRGRPRIPGSPGANPERSYADRHRMYLDAGASWDGKLPRWYDEVRAHYKAALERQQADGGAGPAWMRALSDTAKKFAASKEEIRKIVHSRR